MCEGKEKEAGQKHKGGRPTKRVKRSNHLMVRLTDTERFVIEGKAKSAGVKPSEWFRQAAKRAKVTARLSPKDMEALRPFSGLGNNLNQLMKLAHKDGLFIIVRECSELLKRIAEALKKFYEDDRQDT
jgi:hypothetical protein